MIKYHKKENSILLEYIKSNLFNIVAGLASIVSLVFMLLDYSSHNAALAGLTFSLSLFLMSGTIVLYKIYETKRTFEKKQIDLHNDILNTKKQLSVLNEFQFSLMKIVNRYNTKETELRFMNNEKLDQIDLDYDHEDEWQAQRDLVLESYYYEFKETQKQFFKEIVELVKQNIEKMLSSKNISLDVSLSIKLIDPPVSTNRDSLADLDNCNVKTVFRDSVTFNRGEREINEKSYSVKSNSDFLQCFRAINLSTHEALFINNHLEKSDANYKNENRDYLNYYDAAMVAPITNYYTNDGRLIFGFLTCDTKKQGTNFANDEIFDTDIEGNMLLSAAVGIGLLMTEYHLDTQNLIEEIT